MKYKLKSLWAGAVMAGMLSSSTAFAETELTMVNLAATGTRYLEYTLKFAEQIGAKSNGELIITTSDSLFKGNKHAQAVRDNQVPMASVIMAYYSATNPQFGLHQLPGLINNYEEFRAAFDGFYEEELNKVWNDQYDAKVLSWGLLAPQNLISLEPITSIEDFAGRKIRVHNIETATLVQSFGAQPTALSASEIYTGLQRGVIDGVFTATDYAYGQKYFTVAKNVSLWPIAIMSLYPVVISNDAFNDLPEDMQQLLVDEGARIQEENFANFPVIVDKWGKEWQKQGATYYEATAEQEAALFQTEFIKPVYQAYFERAAEAGFDGKAFVDSALAAMNKTLAYE